MEKEILEYNVDTIYTAELLHSLDMEELMLIFRQAKELSVSPKYSINNKTVKIVKDIGLMRHILKG